LVDITLRKEGEEARRELEEERTRRATHEAERHEERFRRLVEASAQTVWGTDAAGRMQEDSPTLSAFTGRTYEELRGEGWTDAMHPDDRERFLGTWREALAAEASVHFEARLWHAATEAWRWMELRAVPIHGDERGVTGWIGMNIDIDERKQAEEARERMASMLSTVEQEERRRFSQLLHDDLQQMLYAIQMKVAGGVDETDTHQRTERLGVALVLLESAIAKTRELGVELSPPILEGEGFADALRWLRAEMWDLHGLTVEVKESGTIELEPKLRAVLFQTMRELLFNVAKHAGTDRATVEVQAPLEDGELKITVGDGGCGFDPKIADCVTEDGRGFGLASLRQRLHILGGRAEIDSRPGEGTSVTIAVPMHPTR
jgi:PAS domain S-box-containing protein